MQSLNTLFLLIFIFGLTSCFSNKSKFYFSNKNFGEFSGVKLKKEYILYKNFIDTTRISQKVLIEGNLESVEYYNKNGLIIKQIRMMKHDSSQNITTYKYDKKGNLLSEQFRNDKQNLASSSKYEYNNIARKIIKYNTNIQSPIKGNIYKIAKEEKIFNAKNQIIELKYFDKDEFILKLVKNNFDDNSNLETRESYLRDSLKNKRIFSYDSNGRITNSKTFSSEGNLLNERMFKYLNNDVVFLIVYKENGMIRDEIKTIYFRDKKGNITKEYIFNFQKGYTIIKEYLLEYY